MKCKFCGAEIKTGSSVCEYCGCAVEKPAENRSGSTKSSFKGIVGTIAKVVIILAYIWAVVLIIFTVIVLNSDTFKNIHAYTTNTETPYEHDYTHNHHDSTTGVETRKMPPNEEGLIGQVISCNEKGIASIEYDGYIYENIEIPDETFIDWLNETQRSLDTVGICFATDENGNIRTLGLLSAEFFVMGQDGDSYTALRNGDIISFTSPALLETGCYSGYFSYPDMHLYQSEEVHFLPLSYMDSICADKESATMQEYYTGKDITVYRIFTNGKWYYCDKETYDAIEIDDVLNDYNLYDNANLTFITPK